MYTNPAGSHPANHGHSIQPNKPAKITGNQAMVKAQSFTIGNAQIVDGGHTVVVMKGNDTKMAETFQNYNGHLPKSTSWRGQAAIIVN